MGHFAGLQGSMPPRRYSGAGKRQGSPSALQHHASLSPAPRLIPPLLGSTQAALCYLQTHAGARHDVRSTSHVFALFSIAPPRRIKVDFLRISLAAWPKQHFSPPPKKLGHFVEPPHCRTAEMRDYVEGEHPANGAVQLMPRSEPVTEVKARTGRGCRQGQIFSLRGRERCMCRRAR